ncbi:MAG: hypothetical protein CL677_01390 [Bdellovibrionaceae bacterium]|nr:hypothetical protein [Pseudobdellovibrionaceae bacterium]
MFLLDVIYQFFTSPIEALPLLLFRSLFFFTLFLEGLKLFRYRQLYYGSEAMVPPDKKLDKWTTIPLRWVKRPPSYRSMCVLLLVYLFLVLLIMAGVGNRFLAIIHFIFLIGIHELSPLSLNNANNYQRVFALLFCFFPESAISLSVVNYSQDEWVCWAGRLMQIHLSLIYFFEAAFKLRIRSWRRGTSVGYVLNNNELNIRKVEELPIAVYKLLSWGTIVVEFVLAIGLWFPRVSLVFVVIGGLMHLTFGLILPIGYFSLTMLSFLSLFL